MSTMSISASKRVVKTKVALRDVVSTYSIDIIQAVDSSPSMSTSTKSLSVYESHSQIDPTKPLSASQRKNSISQAARSHPPSPPSQEVGDSKPAAEQDISSTADDSKEKITASKDEDKGKEKVLQESGAMEDAKHITEISITLTPGSIFLISYLNLFFKSPFRHSNQ